MQQKTYISAPHEASSAIAVVGLGCRYPGAKNPKELWENIIARRRQFRRMPNVRLPLSDYYSEDKSIPDKTYGTQAAVLDGYTFDWAKHRIPKSTAETTDIAQWLTLDVVLQMLDDAGYTAADLPRSRTQVIIGNTLTGEFTRSNMLRLRWPFIQKILLQNAKQLGVTTDEFAVFSKLVEKEFKSISPSSNEDSLSGGLANTIAGRVCNYLNLNGGGFTVDGACSSSLLSVYTAATHLANNSIDFAIAGGVDISLDPFELVGFAKTGALTQSDMMVYDKRGSGFIPGEGCGIVGMKRLEDAQRDGDKIYAVLDGWGMSSDGKGGITAPTVNGQSMALGRAYQQAGINTADLDFIEGHGTGTKVGDRVELLAIADALKNTGSIQGRHCGVTSFKSIVGHTKAAAGIGAFIKTVMSVNQRVIAPTAGCQDPHEVFSKESDCLYPILRGEVKPPSDSMRAGVSAMGFGGINLHITLSSSDAAGARKQKGFAPVIGERAALASNQDSEVFCLSANTLEELTSIATLLQRDAVEISLAELADFAASNNRTSNQMSVIKAAIVARSPKELATRLTKLLESLAKPSTLNKLMADPENGFLLSINKMDCNLGWVFPGQGSQRANMARVLVERFDWAQDLVNRADAWAAEIGTVGLKDALFAIDDKMITKEECLPALEGLRQTRLAQPAITLVSLLWITYLRRLGLNPKAVMGHSLGELTAFYAAGAFDEKTLIQLATLRGQLMTAESETAAGTMIGIATSGDKVQQMVSTIKQNPSYATSALVIANLNSPTETIASGSIDAINALEQLATEQGVRAKKLMVSNAFHSPIVAPASEKLRASAPVSTIQQSLGSEIISACDGQIIDSGLNLADYFAEQMTRQVDFISATHTLQQHCDVIFEVGPGAVLTQLISKNQPQLMTQSIESQAESFYDVNQLLALAFIHGQSIQWNEVYCQRLIADFISPSEREFLTNPCERLVYENSDSVVAELAIATSIEPGVSVSSHNVNTQQAINHSSSAVQPVVSNTDEYREKVISTVAEFTGFDSASIGLDSSLLDDLNLDSIKSAELVGRLSTTFGVQDKLDPADYATATLAHIIDALKTASDVIGHSAEATVTQQTIRAERNNPVDTRSKKDSIEKKLVAIVAEFTGFEAESIHLDDNLIDDLNLDSIKSAELVGRIIAHFNCHDQLDPANYATATLLQVVSDMNLLDIEPSTVHTSDSNATPHASSPAFSQDVISQTNRDVSSMGEIEKNIASMVSDFTGFDASSIGLEANLLDDLNLDSIKSAELVGRIASYYNGQDKIDPANYAAATLYQVVVDLKLQEPEIQTANADSSVVHNDVKMISNAQTTAPAVSHTNDLEDQSESSGIDQFWMQPVRSHLSLNDIPQQLSGRFAIYYTSKTDLVDTLTAQLQSKGAEVLWMDDNVVTENLSTSLNHALDGIIVLLPSPTSASYYLDSLALEQSVHRLHSIALTAVKHQPLYGITFVQFGGNSVSVGADFSNTTTMPLVSGNIHTASTSAFAATLHLENETLKVRTIDFNVAVDQGVVADRVFAELGHQALYSYSHYDQQGERYTFTPVPINIQQQASRPINWSQQDIIVVTGGGKGITAECAMALAKSTGARMVLVGSSAANDEVNQILQRYRQMELFAQYNQCNITNKTAVQQMVAQIQTTLGDITGIIHGAGLNKAKRFEQTKPADAIAEISPKLLGISHLCEAVAHRPPKMIVGFSSIIGVTGMPGNAWYAFSNEALNLTLQQFATINPQTQVVSLAYSVWGEVGMGARMGSVKRLAGLGISAIPTQAGINHFLASMLHQQPAHQVVITGSLGGLDTWSPQVSTSAQEVITNIEAPSWRFLQNIISLVPNQEIIARTTLSLEDDLYLLDHNYRGTYLFPTVFGLEAMAQTVARLLGLDTLPPLQMTEINLPRPIAVGSEVSQDGTTVIQIKATVDSGTAAHATPLIKVGISTEQSGFTRDHFSANFILSQPNLAQNSFPPLPGAPVAIDPARELYGDLLFQGSLFRRLKTVWSMSSQRSMTSIEANPSAQYYSAPYGNTFILGDPACRDVLLQSAQLSLKGILLPTGIDSIEWFGDGDSDNILTNTEILSRTNDAIFCSVVAVNQTSGKLVERMSGYRLKQMELEENGPTPEDWALPEQRDQQLLAQQLDQAADYFKVGMPEYRLTYAPQFHQMKREQRRSLETPVLSSLVQQVYSISGAAVPVMKFDWDQNGKPFVTMANINDKGIPATSSGVSLSHDSRHCLYVAGQGMQGCDLEPISERTKEAWLSVFASQYHSALERLIANGDNIDQAGTRLWCALESIKKAGGKEIHLNTVNNVKDTSDSQAILLEFSVDQQAMKVMTLALRLTRPPVKMIAMIVGPKAALGATVSTPTMAISSAFSDNHSLRDLTTFESAIYSGIREDEHSGGPILCYRFMVTFKETTTMDNTVNFDTYADWMGLIRERALVAVADDMVMDFLSGRWGMVTNNSHVDILQPIKCMEVVEARLRILRAYGKYNSSVDMQFDWVKINSDGSETVVARSYMATTWVEIIGHGHVKVQPFPRYMEVLIADYLPKIDRSNVVLLERKEPNGECLYRAPSTPRMTHKIMSRQFDTTSSESNLVGNIYYANYYHWQSRVVDTFYHLLAKDIQPVPQGRFHCTHSKVSHLREAMPYDTIEVVLAISAIYRDGVKFQLEVYRIDESGQKLKLTTIEHYSVWHSSVGVSSDIPSQYIDILLSRVHTDSSFEVDSRAPNFA